MLPQLPQDSTKLDNHWRLVKRDMHITKTVPPFVPIDTAQKTTLTNFTSLFCKAWALFSHGNEQIEKAKENKEHTHTHTHTCGAKRGTSSPAIHCQHLAIQKLYGMAANLFPCATLIESKWSCQCSVRKQRSGKSSANVYRCLLMYHRLLHLTPFYSYKVLVK